MTRFILTLLLILGQPVAAWSQTAQSDLPRVVLQAGMYQLDVQVAATPLQREVGLMYRQSMPTHEGMVFVFEQAQQQCFWMKNTLLPLTAAFVADDGVIVNLADMKPQTTSLKTQPEQRHIDWQRVAGLQPTPAHPPAAPTSAAPADLQTSCCQQSIRPDAHANHESERA
jgi:uncharacterized membrane protein (UPF0127 family)